MFYYKAVLRKSSALRFGNEGILGFLGEILQRESRPPKQQTPPHDLRLVEKHSSEAHLGTCSVVWLRLSVVSGSLSILFLSSGLGQMEPKLPD